MSRIAVISALALAACGTANAPEAAVPVPGYQGIETSLLADDLVRFDVTMTNVSQPNQLRDYAECAATQYALIRGFGFARHLRTNVDEKGGVWVADAVYTISPSLPRGLETLDAEVVVASCAENGIPTV
ncbi:MAG: hypothetical protein CML02_10015 [Pseudooceanicola sp.]|jgi:hypothetical protein|nr:hypothetical protein [Pseudooceanicola sp.]|tara:strand:+ start:201 stop:587 length:387 start_codon:yes stop_codon:yes gene_type:complete